MFRKFIVVAVFVVGLSIFFYPIVSDWFNTQEHHSSITKHNEAWKNMSDKKKEQERQKAEEYNAALQNQPVSIEDPFAEEVSGEVEEDQHYLNVLDIGEAMGSIEIPSIDVRIPIYHGVSEDVLSQGIGHMPNSSLPVGGKGNHAALTGHRGLPSSKLFRNLDEIKVKDRFQIHTLGETLTYEVDDIQIVLPTETSWLEFNPTEDLVTLITCEPYMINTHRLLVRGKRIPTEETKEATALVTPDGPMIEAEKPMYLLWIALLILLMSILTYWYIRRRKRWKRR
ncbi:class C sortase [Allobacillus sp. SKP2-8]|uniref:class C sortase n=1 Tax=unclassified Allobacillus TaxID=2628859 RepID=UPI0011833B46|nr:class C sortase [Allobacillus sp. SKP2-8]TSJ67367.1 class C sortase [Allobacillus sp. SKP2-8]